MWDCMNLAVFSFQAWGESPVLMMLLMSLSVRPMFSHSSVHVGCVSHPLPLDFSLLICGLFQVVRMGFSPRQMCLVLHALWSLRWSPLQLTHFSPLDVGCSSVLWSFELHTMHLGCLQLDMQCENMPHFVHWDTCGLSLYGVIVQS